MQNFDQLHRFFTQHLEKEISNLTLRQPEHLYHPVIYTLNMGGKRIRPIVLLMACELFTKNIEKALPAAMAIEMFHNFTLLHDDIMDNADLRRNKETVHIKYSENTAILSGDAMSIVAYEYLNKSEVPAYKNIFELFTQTALQICEGQQYDMDFETRKDVTVDEYLKMISLKTAVLLAASLKIGAYVGNANEKDAQSLYDFGFNLGMAFQLQDDLLDTFGTTENFGKNIGGDIVSNKKTFLLLKALELATGETLNELKSLTSVTNFIREEKIQKVKNIYTEIGVVELSEAKKEEYYKKALNSLNEVNIDTASKNELMQVAQQMMNRKN